MRRIMTKTIFRWTAIGIAILAVNLVLFGLYSTSKHSDHRSDVIEMDQSEVNPTEIDLKTVVLPLHSEMLKIKENLVELAKEIQRTKIHIRGAKAREAASRSISIVKNLLKMTHISETVLKRKTRPSTHICGEVYKGTTYGYPFFYKGFEQKNCSYSTKIEKLVTVILIHKHDHIYNLENILNEITVYNKNLTILVGTFKNLNKSMINVKSIIYQSSESDGNILNSLIKLVKTEYVLIVRNITNFNIDSRLERLIREVESLNVTVAAGSSRDQNGHWKLGCFQSVYRNYSLIYSEGYDESLHECIFCDYVDNSFVIKSEKVQKIGFDKDMDGVSVYHDFFLRLSETKLESVVCPDSMFYVNRQKRSDDLDYWKPFKVKWELSRMIFSDEIDLKFKCENGYNCFHGLGFAVTPCCLQELADMVKFVMKICEDNKIICELQEGSLLGAVKLHKILPWERDADLTFLTSNFTEFTKLKNQIKSKYAYSDDPGSVWCCADNRTAGGKMKVNSKHWHIELYGQHMMDSEMMLKEGTSPTKVLLDGQWVAVPRNPGWHARNRYGHEIYAHAQHWMAIGKGDGWINYETNHFTTCKTPGKHNCLDRYNADGNMQFGIPIP